MLSTSSNAPRTVVPAVATTRNGRQPSVSACTSLASRSLTSILPLSHEALTRTVNVSSRRMRRVALRCRTATQGNALIRCVRTFRPTHPPLASQPFNGNCPGQPRFRLAGSSPSVFFLHRINSNVCMGRMSFLSPTQPARCKHWSHAGKITHCMASPFPRASHRTSKEIPSRHLWRICYPYSLVLLHIWSVSVRNLQRNIIIAYIGLQFVYIALA